MSSTIHVHCLPDHFTPDLLAGGIAVVVDVLRASTSILTALHNGAAGIIPCLSVDEARTHRSNDSTVLLGGERGGVRLHGFDLSNSPADYDHSVVQNRTIAFTTTNGTRALLHSANADQVLVGAFVNVGRLSEYLRSNRQPLHIVCAGTDGTITGEDVLFAGCLIERLMTLSIDRANIELTDPASMALGWWQHESAQRSLAETLKRTQGGKNLVALSFDGDIELAVQQDCCPVVARFNPSSGRITT